MTSFWEQASWAKMTSTGVKLTSLVCHPTIKVNKAELPIYLCKNICKQYEHPGDDQDAYLQISLVKVLQIIRFEICNFFRIPEQILKIILLKNVFLNHKFQESLFYQQSFEKNPNIIEKFCKCEPKLLRASDFTIKLFTLITNSVP